MKTTIADHIVCPVQATEAFTFGACYSCKNFDLHKTASGWSPNCRAQKTPARKRAFKSAAMLDRLGVETIVVVDAKKEGEPNT